MNRLDFLSKSFLKQVLNFNTRKQWKTKHAVFVATKAATGFTERFRVLLARYFKNNYISIYN